MLASGGGATTWGTGIGLAMGKSAIAKEAKTRRGRVRQIVPDLGSIDPNSAESAERQAYALIRRAIMMGVFEPGATITGRSIAESLGVSSTPVRDALKRLEADGVVEGRHRSAYHLKELTRSQYLEVMSLRALMEGRAAAEAAKLATDDDIVRLATINDEYRHATKRESIRANFYFHFEIYCLAKSQLLLDLIEKMWMRIGPLMHLHFLEYDQMEVAGNHAAIIDALRNHNPAAAQRALQRDLSAAARGISRLLSPDKPSGSGSAAIRSSLSL